MGYGEKLVLFYAKRGIFFLLVCVKIFVLFYAVLPCLFLVRDLDELLKGFFDSDLFLALFVFLLIFWSLVYIFILTQAPPDRCQRFFFFLVLQVPKIVITVIKMDKTNSFRSKSFSPSVLGSLRFSCVED